MQEKIFNEIYFDNAATTKVHKEVADLAYNIMTKDYGNPSSKHRKGFEAEEIVKKANVQIADILKCNENEIVWTSGGTESDNYALIGAAFSYQRRGKHIISSNIEHPAIYKTLEYLSKFGFEITYLKVDKDGKVNPQDLKNNIRKDTILISIMHINNEIGSINDIENLAKISKNENPQVIFHTDAIQSFGKFKIYPKLMNIDMVSVSGHKIHSPKGIGFLYINKNINLLPIINGGGQQKNRRSGTHNTVGIACLAEASKMAYTNFDEKMNKIIIIKNLFLDGLNNLNEEIGGIKINSKKDFYSAPQILSVTINGIKAEVILHALEEKNIFVSSGSACSSNHPDLSGTLKAIGLSNEEIDSTIRFSFSIYNEIEEVEYTLKELKQIIINLRKYTKK
ncbi:MAG: cysteine desulfurase family protein [Eubacteriales bacterium]|nr:cysteine desulfurase family protein [Eubacteriales bacterium]